MSPIPWFFARLLVGGVFMTAGWVKLMEPAENFQLVLEGFSWIPFGVLPVLSRIVPWLELVTGLFLAVGFCTRQAAVVVFLLCLIFLITLTVPVLSGKGSEVCGCFGASGLLLTKAQIYLWDWVSLILSGFLFRQKRHHPAVENLLK